MERSQMQSRPQRRKAAGSNEVHQVMNRGPRGECTLGSRTVSGCGSVKERQLKHLPTSVPSSTNARHVSLCVHELVRELSRSLSRDQWFVITRGPPIWGS